MASGTLAIFATQPSRIPHPALTATSQTVSYEVRNLNGEEYRYLCAAVPTASYIHKGDGWTRVTVPLRLQSTLEQYLTDFFPFAHARV